MTYKREVCGTVGGAGGRYCLCQLVNIAGRLICTSSCRSCVDARAESFHSEACRRAARAQKMANYCGSVHINVCNHYCSQCGAGVSGPGRPEPVSTLGILPRTCRRRCWCCPAASPSPRTRRVLELHSPRQSRGRRPPIIISVSRPSFCRVPSGIRPIYPFKWQAKRLEPGLGG